MPRPSAGTRRSPAGVRYPSYCIRDSPGAKLPGMARVAYLLTSATEMTLADGSAYPADHIFVADEDGMKQAA